MRTEKEVREKIKEERIPEGEELDEYHAGVDEGWKAALEWVLEPSDEEPCSHEDTFDHEGKEICSYCGDPVEPPDEDLSQCHHPCVFCGLPLTVCKCKKPPAERPSHAGHTATVEWDEVHGDVKRIVCECGAEIEHPFKPAEEPEDRSIDQNCDGCSYHVPEDEEDTCHAPKGGAPPTDALCYEDYAEARREADAEEGE